MDTVTLQTILSFYKPNTMQEKIQSVAQLAVHSGYTTYQELFAPFVEAGLRVPSWFTLEREWERNFFS
uniref:Polyprotein n=1 Tax=Crocidura shantungensis picorna-like virus 4 TaxID=3139524 RepID=A0AB38ZJW2_9VIRU